MTIPAGVVSDDTRVTPPTPGSISLPPTPAPKLFSQLPDTAQQRITANVTKLRQAGGTDDQIHRYLQQGEGLAKPPAPPTSSWSDKIAETLSSGLPGGRYVLAAGAALPDLLTGKGLDVAKQDFNTSLDRQQRDVASMPVAAQIPLKLLGGAPLAAAVAPLGVIGGSAAFGAASGADAPASSSGDRLLHMGIGAAGGAAGGAVLQGVGNIATRAGVTDQVGNAVTGFLKKIGVEPATAEDATANLGTRGQVNAAMGTRQQMLGAVGDVGETAAKQQQDQMATFKAQTDANYNLARQDKAVIQDPQLNELLQDKDIAPIMKKVSAIRESSGKPMPTLSTNTVLSPRDNGLLSSDDIASASAAFDRAYGSPGGSANALPDPEAIHSLKRYLNESVDRGMDSKLEITRDQARALLPKAQAITARFHELSPDWATADQFHAAGKGEEEAYNAGVDAFKNAANPSAENMATNSAEAMQQAITTPRYPNEPPEALAGRAAAFQRGMRASAADAVRDAPVTKNMSTALSDPVFAQTEKAAKLRSLMFSDPSQTDAMEETIAKLAGTAKKAGGSSGNYNQPVINKFSLLRKLARLGTTPDMLNTPQGTLFVNQLMRDPDFLQRTLSAASGTGTVLPSILTGIGSDASGQATRAIFGPGRSR